MVFLAKVANVQRSVLAIRASFGSRTQEQAEPTTAEYLASITGSDSQQAQDQLLP